MLEEQREWEVCTSFEFTASEYAEIGSHPNLPNRLKYNKNWEVYQWQISAVRTFTGLQSYKKNLPKTEYNVTSLLKTDWIMSINSKLLLTNFFHMQILHLVSVMQSEPYETEIADVHI